MAARRAVALRVMLVSYPVATALPGVVAVSPVGRSIRATASHGGTDMEQWQIEVTGAGRIWYLLDPAKRTLWMRLATTGHRGATD